MPCQQIKEQLDLVVMKLKEDWGLSASRGRDLKEGIDEIENSLQFDATADGVRNSELNTLNGQLDGLVDSLMTHLEEYRRSLARFDGEVRREGCAELLPNLKEFEILLQSLDDLTTSYLCYSLSRFRKGVSRRQAG